MRALVADPSIASMFAWSAYVALVTDSFVSLEAGFWCLVEFVAVVVPSDSSEQQMYGNLGSGVYRVGRTLA
ncbi:MAG: hypothetical protein ACRDSE_10975 [Pseudonocardiaceae bacterium]